MNKLATFFYNKSTLALALAITVVVFSYLFFVMMDVAKCFEVVGSDHKSLGTSFGFSYDTVIQFFAIRSADMVACYKDFNSIWDNLFALLYGLMYISWLSLLFKPYQTSVKFLNLLPILQVVFDWLENCSLVGIANAHLAGEQIATSAVDLASFFVQAKWISSGLLFMALFVGMVLRIRTAFKKRKA